jgi:hypothetical protein
MRANSPRSVRATAPTTGRTRAGIPPPRAPSSTTLPRLYDRRVVASDLPATFAQLAAARTLATEVFVSYAPAR